MLQEIPTEKRKEFIDQFANENPNESHLISALNRVLGEGDLSQKNSNVKRINLPTAIVRGDGKTREVDNLDGMINSKLDRIVGINRDGKPVVRKDYEVK